MGNEEAVSNNVCEKFYKYLESAVCSIFRKKKSGKQSKFPTNEWFDDDCKNVKRIVNDFAKTNDLKDANT